MIPNLPLQRFSPPFPSYFPKRAAVFIVVYPENTVDGRAIYFQEEDEKLFAALQKGKKGRIQDILIQSTRQKGSPLP